MEIVQASKVNGVQVFRTKSGKIIGQGRRRVKDGSKYNHLVNASDVQFKSSLTYGDVDDTISKMIEIIEKYHYQVNDLAQFLKKDTALKTCKSIWTFVFNHIQYKRDKQGVEQLTVPARIWLSRIDEATPGDCDDHTIFVGSLLYCLGIPFKIRIAGYDGRSFSHVYIIAEGDICIDTVLHAFNKEAYYTSKKDSKMMQIEVLHGLDGAGALGELGELGDLGAVSALAASSARFEETINRLLPSDSSLENYHDDEELNGFEDFESQQLNAFKRLGVEHLAITLRDYEQEPELYHAKGFSPEYWRLMRKAYNALKNGTLNGIVVNLSNGAEWERKNLSPLNGVENEDGQVTGLMGFLDGLFKKIRRGFKKFAKWTKKSIKKAAKWVGKIVKKIHRFMMKINPIMIGVRTILRFKISKNKKDLAITLGIGLMTAQDAAKAGITTAEHNKAKRALAKFIKKYRFLGGKTSKIKSVIAKAYKKYARKENMPDANLHGLGNLAELEGRRRRRRRRRRRAAAKAARLKEAKRFKAESKKLLSKKLSKFKREQLEFLKVAFKDEAKRHGLADPATAGSAAASVPIATKIINWILKMLGKLGLKKVIQKLKKKRIDNLGKKAKEAVNKGMHDVAAKLLEKKKKAENNLVIFNQDTGNYPVKQKPDPTPNPTGDNGKASATLTVPTDTNLLAPKVNKAGFNPILIGGMVLVFGGMLLKGSGKDKKNQNKNK